MNKAEADQHLRTLTTAVEQSASTVMLTDTRGSILYVNKHFTILTGYTADEVLGKTPQILNSGKTSKEFYQNMWNTLLSRNDWRGELQNRRKNGELYWESLNITPILNAHGEIVSFLGIAEDITKRKELEEALYNSLEETTRVNKELEHFNSMVSHDLQGPLNAIQTGLEFIENKLNDSADKDTQKIVSSVQAAVGEAITLIQDLLVLSRINHKNWQPVTVNLASLLQSVIDSLYSEIEATRAQIVYSDLPTIEGNQTLIRELLYNLIANAIKYHDKFDPLIKIGACIADELITFNVSDNGIGILPEETDQVFQPFMRGSNTQSFPGTGLGLSLCKRIVELHEGQIWVESCRGKGSTFYFTIPKKIRQ